MLYLNQEENVDFIISLISKIIEKLLRSIHFNIFSESNIKLSKYETT